VGAGTTEDLTVPVASNDAAVAPGTAGPGVAEPLAAPSLPEPVPASRSRFGGTFVLPRVGFAWLRLEALIPFAIAVVSLVGAAVTWRASDTAGRAGGMDTQALRESVELRQIDSGIDAVLAHDQRVFAEYQEHIVAWHALAQRAAETKDADLAGDLRWEAHAELALARTLRPLFRAFVPSFGDKDGLVTYDSEVAVAWLQTQSSRRTELDPDATLQEANRLHEHAVSLVGVVILLVGALFLLTVAQLGRARIRLTFGVLGILAAVGATTAFLLLEGVLG